MGLKGFSSNPSLSNSITINTTSIRWKSCRSMLLVNQPG